MTLSGSRPPDQTQRQLIVDELDTTLLVEAAAGTGKTTSLVARMIALLRTDRCRVENLAAVTFTRKAASELRVRFQAELQLAARTASGEIAQRLAEAVTRIDRCVIGTIHSFCARLLRERPIEAGVDLEFEELDDAQDSQLRSEAWSEYVAGLFTQENGVLTELQALGLHVQQLQDSFLTFASYPDVEVWPAPDPPENNWDSLRGEVAEYIQHMEQLAPTFPADKGNDELMSTYQRIVRVASQRDLDEPSNLMELLELFKASTGVVQKNWPSGRIQGKAEKTRWEDFCTRIAEPAVARWRAKRYQLVIRVLAQASAVYDQLRQTRGRLNYQDLLLRAAQLLRDQPQIRRYFRGRFSHLLVDEFQDTDPIQAEVMLLLTADDPTQLDWRKCRPVPGSLFVVGDPKQSIYRFRRADIVTYNRVREIILESGGRVVPLTANFRTVKPVVEWGNAVFDQVFPAQATEHSPPACPMQAAREGDATGELMGIHILEIPPESCASDDVVRYEADFIARYIRQSIDSKRSVPRSKRELQHGASRAAAPGDFLIVTWSKKHLAEYAQTLQAWGIPHQVSGGSGLRRLVQLRLLRDCLRALSEPENPVALVAVLRGELFGFSDIELYAYRRAGGRFSFRASVPEDLDVPLAQRFQEVFERLQGYAHWMRRLPPVTCIERLAGDLGLLAQAATAPDGNLQAGSMAKVLELLRSLQAEFPAVAELTERLTDLIDQNAEFDGLPARSQEGSVVRIMNLHKVKGLEAPVVFLADPTGQWSPPVRLHIDRSHDRVSGYLAVEEQHGRQTRLLACPLDWGDHAAAETIFCQSELNRLFYVASTRAGTELAVTRKADRNRTNYWDFFTPYLQKCDVLADPGNQKSPVIEQIKLSSAEVQTAHSGIEHRWSTVTKPSYATAASKQVALSAAGLFRPAAGTEYGTEWGTVVHFLLETAMRVPGTDLHGLAYAALEEQGMDPALAPQAVDVVARVRKSDVWRRAAASQRRLIEVPFGVCLSARQIDQALPTVLRGVIDLAFLEPAGWVLVDYKTDSAARDQLEMLVERYRPQVALYAKVWQETIGEQVSEQGLLFTETNTYAILSPVYLKQ
jgi:ATP-dependent helicase/nuclease subunit A